MTDPTVSNLILRQLGGMPFLVLTGACDISHDARSVTMRLPKANPGIVLVRVTMTDLDLYDIATLNRDGVVLDVRVDEAAKILPRTFEEMTGRRTGW